jgi:hypothetical protein
VGTEELRRYALLGGWNWGMLRGRLLVVIYLGARGGVLREYQRCLIAGVCVVVLVLPWAKTEAQTGAFPSSASVSKPDWHALFPAIEQVIKAVDWSEVVEDVEPRISQVGFLKGARIHVATIDVGGMGAYTDAVEVVQIQNGRPVLARFRGKNGNVAEGEVFAEGASVMNAVEVQILAKDDAVASIHLSLNDNGGVNSCKAEAYRWSPRTRSFNWNPELSRRVCADARRDRRQRR